jgi:hypothetical protein
MLKCSAVHSISNSAFGTAHVYTIWCTGPGFGSKEEQLWHFSHYCHVSQIGIEKLDNYGKGKAIPIRAWTGPEAPRGLRLPDFKTIGILRW